MRLLVIEVRRTGHRGRRAWARLRLRARLAHFAGRRSCRTCRRSTRSVWTRACSRFAALMSATDGVVFGLAPAWIATSVDPRRLLGTARRHAFHALAARRGSSPCRSRFRSRSSCPPWSCTDRSTTSARRTSGYTPAHVVEVDSNAAERGYDAPRNARSSTRVAWSDLPRCPAPSTRGSRLPRRSARAASRQAVRPWEASDRRPIKGQRRSCRRTTSPRCRSRSSPGAISARTNSCVRCPTRARSSSALGLAQKLFGSTPAVGRRLATGDGRSARAADVIGVVGDVKSGGFARRAAADDLPAVGAGLRVRDVARAVATARRIK